MLTDNKRRQTFLILPKEQDVLLQNEVDENSNQPYWVLAD